MNSTRGSFKPREIFGLLPLAIALLALLAVACSSSEDSTTPGQNLSGDIEIDGSSTLFPVSEAVAEEFGKVHSGVQVQVGQSGTGGGFQRFTDGETDISDASRAIRESEAQAAADNGVEFYELKIGTDGLTVMVHPSNNFVDCLTVEELKMIWEPGSTITRWNQVRPEWPNQNMILFGPDANSGTFDYFTEEIVGEIQASRDDYTKSADDNFLVRGISGTQGSLGYFGYAYYLENADSMKIVAIDSGSGCVAPSAQTIESGQYTPLSRPLYIYVNKNSLNRPEVRAFVEFYMTHGAELVSEVGYIPEDALVYQNNLALIGN